MFSFAASVSFRAGKYLLLKCLISQQTGLASRVWCILVRFRFQDIKWPNLVPRMFALWPLFDETYQKSTIFNCEFKMQNILESYSWCASYNPSPNHWPHSNKFAPFEILTIKRLCFCYRMTPSPPNALNMLWDTIQHWAVGERERVLYFVPMLIK